MPIYSRLKLVWIETLCISPTTAKWSKTAQPLPHPPFYKILNTVFLKTITDNFLFYFRFKPSSILTYLNITFKMILTQILSILSAWDFGRVSGLGWNLMWWISKYGWQIMTNSWQCWAHNFHAWTMPQKTTQGKFFSIIWIWTTSWHVFNANTCSS